MNTPLRFAQHGHGEKAQDRPSSIPAAIVIRPREKGAPAIRRIKPIGIKIAKPVKRTFIFFLADVSKLLSM